MLALEPENIINILNNPSYGLLFLALMIWSLLWKGIALWKAARHNQRNWFVVMLVLNTLGVVEIIYLFYFQAKGEKNGERNVNKN